METQHSEDEDEDEDDLAFARMVTRYDLLYTLSLPLVAPYLAWRHYSKGKYTESAGGMLGRRLPKGEAARRFEAGSLWVHAVSVGEVTAARAVIPGLRRLRPELPLVVSTVTETGQAAARRFFGHDHGITLTYFPLDFSLLVRRFQEVFRPRVFVLLETELWPNFLTQAAARGTRCFMINAKISDLSYPRYRSFRGLLRPALAALGGVCAQTAVDAERFADLGVAPALIRVNGNVKFDLEQKPLSGEERRALMALFGMSPERRWIVAGSTHPGEEALILEAFKQVRARVPGAGLLLCPRHPERFDEAARLAEAAGLRTGRASAPNLAADAEVIILDKMGVLAKAYGLGETSIVAGSFCSVGGHNLLEAAAHGVPVVYGPDMHSQREIDRLFNETGAGLQVTPEALAPTLVRLLEDARFRAEEGQKGYRLIEANRGAAQRAVAAIGEWLGRA